MKWPEQVTIVEVGPRDGLQSETLFIPTEIKLAFIDQLTKTGLSHVEITSFSSATQVPQLADHEKILTTLNQTTTCIYPVIVPTENAAKKAIDLGAKHLAVLASASEGFSTHNTRCSIKEGIKRIEKITTLANQAAIPVRSYLSCVIACPYDGNTNPKSVAHLAKQLIDLGCYEVSLSDTIGVGTPRSVKQMLDQVLTVLRSNQCAVHFHDTYGQAIANIYEALSYQIAVIDSSVAGLGGCPYAPGASGNVATEDVLYLLHGLGIKTNIDLSALVKAGEFICHKLGKLPMSKVAKALRSHPAN